VIRLTRLFPSLSLASRLKTDETAFVSYVTHAEYGDGKEWKALHKVKVLTYCRAL